HATFVRPSTLAAFLVLLLPGLGGAGVACVRGKAPGWLTAFATGCALAGLAGGGGGRGRGAPVGPGRGRAAGGRGGRGRARGGGVALGFGLAGVGALAEPLARWRDLWPGSWDLVRAHSWLGVGPENFSLWYPRYMAETSALKPAAPSSFLLEVWAAAGPVAVL